MPLTFTPVAGDWRVITGRRITGPDDEPGVTGTVKVSPQFTGGMIADDITYSVQPLVLHVRRGLLLDPNMDPDIRLATAVDGQPVTWRAKPALTFRGRDLRLEPFTFTANDHIDGVIWLSSLPAIAQ